MICIYKIISPSGKIYIGQTGNSDERLYHYKKLNCKDQVRLYRSLKKYSWDNHIFDIIEKCNIDELNCRERYWQDFYNVIGKSGLNCKLTPCGEKRTEISLETKQKISNTMKGRKYSQERISNVKNSLIGRKLSQNHKGKLSIISKERFKDPEIRKRFIETGMKKVYQYSLDNILINTFRSAAEASLHLSIDSSSISACCRGKRKSAGKFIWSFKKK